MLLPFRVIMAAFLNGAVIPCNAGMRNAARFKRNAPFSHKAVSSHDSRGMGGGGGVGITPRFFFLVFCFGYTSYNSCYF